MKHKSRLPVVVKNLRDDVPSINTMLDNPLITTIIPTYQRADLLERALKSILQQSFSQFQVIICDNASEDHTKELVAHYKNVDPRILYFRHSANIGALQNFKFGLSKVNTSYFSFLSDDDYLLPHFFERALKGFEDFPAAGFSACSTAYVNEKGKILDIPLKSWPREGLYTPMEGFPLMFDNRHPQWAGILFRTSVLESIGGLDLETGPPLDLDFELRISARLPFVISKKPGAVFMCHPQSSCISSNISFVWPGWLKIIDNIKRDPEISWALKLEAERRLLHQFKKMLFRLAIKGLCFKRYQEAFLAADLFRDYFHAPGKRCFLIFITHLFRKLPELSIITLSIKNFLDNWKNRDLKSISNFEGENGKQRTFKTPSSLH